MNLSKIVLLIAISLSLLTSSASATTDLLWSALEVKADVKEKLATCGTIELQTNDNRLPRRQVPAHEALANLETGEFFGYFYRQSMNNGSVFTWKRKNGGKIASMTLGDDSRLEFSLAYGGGRIAHVSQYFTSTGEHFNYWCGSRRVDLNTFKACIENRWMRELVSTFCSK
jgi:hypothetical protein